MATRNKIYYPQSHIVNNLTTSGKEWMLENGTEYIGYYHRYIDGTQMTGAVFNSKESKLLKPYINHVIQPDNLVYNKLKKVVTHKAPYTIFPIPVLQDYKNGKLTRYFLKRRNRSTYEDIFEIDKKQYMLVKNSKGGIDSNLYQPITLDWKLTGPLHDVKTGINTEYGVADTNKRIVYLKNLKMPGIVDVLTDYIELTIYSKYVSNDIKKLFV
jgi:hypothetical protein